MNQIARQKSTYPYSTWVFPGHPAFKPLRWVGDQSYKNVVSSMTLRNTIKPKYSGLPLYPVYRVNLEPR